MGDVPLEVVRAEQFSDYRLHGILQCKPQPEGQTASFMNRHNLNTFLNAAMSQVECRLYMVVVDRGVEVNFVLIAMHPFCLCGVRGKYNYKQ